MLGASATIGSSSMIVGTILAGSTITFEGTSVLKGHGFATDAITFNGGGCLVDPWLYLIASSLAAAIADGL